MGDTLTFPTSLYFSICSWTQFPQKVAAKSQIFERKGSKKYSKMCLSAGGRHPTHYFPRRHIPEMSHFFPSSKKRNAAIHHANELHFHIFTFFHCFELWEKLLCAPGEGENYEIQSKARREEGLVKSKTRRRREGRTDKKMRALDLEAHVR